MVQIQLSLSKKENNILELYKIANNFKTKAEALKHIILFFEVDIKYKNKEVKQ